MEIIHNRTPESIRSAASRVKIFAARSNRLASRLIRVKEELEKSQIITPQTDLHSKANINLLPVTADDIMEYFELLSDYSPGLVRHLQKYGSDEECFYKWHERLRLIGVAVGVNGIPDIFDLKVDSEDLRHDTFQLRQSIDSITSDVQDQEAIKKMLLSQETIAYKTIPNNDSGVTIKAKMIKYDRLLGKGSFGEVWKARIMADFVAVKKIPATLLTDEAKNNLKVEAEVMRLLSHPGIVACIGVVDEEADFCLIMELCAGGSLENLIKTRTDLSLRTELDLALDIANAMSYLHRLHVVHRDLKPGNIVLDSNMRPKITDFGLAFKQSSTMTSFRGTEMGTPAFMAPECFGLTPVFSTRSDVFAFGIVLWQLLHLEVPYVDVTPLEIRDSIREGSRLPISPDIHQDLAKLVTQSWDQNPRNRPTFTEIVVFLKAFLATNPLVNMELPTRLILPTIPSSKIKPGSLDGKKSHNSSGDFVKPVPTNLSYSKKKKLVIVGLVVALVVASIIGIVVAVVVNLNKSANESSSTLSTTASATTFTTTFSSSIGSATFTSSSAPVRTSIPIFPSSNVNVSTLVKKTDLENISGITIDEDDNLYVVTSINNSGTVYRVNPDGTTADIYTYKYDGLGNEYDDQGLCYFDGFLYLPRMTQVHRIDLRNGNTPSRFTGSVNSSTTIITGDPDIATFNKAINCVADRNGSIYVTDFWSNTGYVRHLSKNGNVSTFLTDTDIQPIIGLGFDNSEKLLVTSWQGSGVFRRLDSTNIIRVDIFDSPTSVVSDLFGNLFVVEGGNTQALYWIDTNSVKRLLVKNRPSKFGLQNGNATMALFNVPKMSVFDSKGRLYVTDQRNGAVRMITWN